MPSRGADPRCIVHVFGVMDRGGAELRPVEVVEHLAPEGLDTVYVTLTGRMGQLGDRIRASGDRVVPLRLDARFPVAFVRLLRSVRADVVHSHVATFSGATLTLARLARVPRRIAHFRSDGDQRPDTPVRRAQRWFMRRLVSWSATDIVGVSPGALDHGWRPRWRADARCRVIANGIDVDLLPAVDDRRSVRADLGIAPGTPLMCHVGRPAAVKNRGRAVDLACHPAVARCGVVLLLVGAMEDGEAERWRSRARSRQRERALQITGVRRDVLRILNASDLTLLTSTHEGLPGVVLESLAVGTPVVASDLPGVRWIAKQLAGVQIRRLDEQDDAWARSILSALALAGDDDHRARLRESFASSRFRLETAAAELASLWRA